MLAISQRLGWLLPRAPLHALLIVSTCLAVPASGCDTPRPQVQSPLSDAVLEGDWAPVVVLLPLDWQDVSFTIRLDGQPVVDPLAVIRRRSNSKKEPGKQLLASLSLFELEPGEHRLEVQLERPWRLDRTLSSRFVTQPRQHRVTLRLHDGSGAPINGRVVVRDHDGPVRLTDRSGWRTERKSRNSDLDAVFVRDGVGEVRLDSGWYRLVATRGLQDAVAVVELELDGDRDLDLALPRLVDLPDAVTADLHVHTGASYDAYVPHAVRMHSLACSGLDLVVLTDHNRIARVQPYLDVLAGHVAVPELVPGIEGDLRGRTGKNWDWGHLTAFPLVASAAPPSRWPGIPAQALVAWHRRQAQNPHATTGSDLLLTLAHPRGIQFRSDLAPRDHAWSLFNNLGYRRELPLGVGPNAWMSETADDGRTTVMDFDALEVVNRMGLEKYREVRLDWFALLNQGHLLAGVGGSDSHALAVELVGWPQTVVYGADTRPEPSDMPGIVQAIRAGRTSVTTGPYVELELVSGDRRAGLGGLITPGDEPLQAVITVRAAPWVPVHELRLVQDGRVVHRVDLGGRTSDHGPAFERVETVELELERDGWLLAEAGWPVALKDKLVGGTYSVVAPGYVPFAFTSPIRVDVDGDGLWTPPGLPASQEPDHGG